jgi:hypothetical protein
VSLPVPNSSFSTEVYAKIVILHAFCAQDQRIPLVSLALAQQPTSSMGLALQAVHQLAPLC